MKRIHIKESTFNRLLFEDNNDDELDFKTFYDNVLVFIKGLLNDPINTKPNETLQSYGITNGDLRKKLCDFGVLSKKEDIREPYDDSSGKQESRYYMSYKLSTDNFKEKLRQIHREIIK